MGFNYCGVFGCMNNARTLPHLSYFRLPKDDESFRLGLCNFSTSRVVRAEYGPLEIGRCTLGNGIKLVSAKPFGAQMAACTILFQAGSRYEYDDQLGVTHFLRTCSGASGCSYTTFSKTRVLQQLGVYLTVNTDRQSVAYTLRCPVPNFRDVKYYLLDIAARAAFKQHEVDARKAQVKLDLQVCHPEALLMDLIQKACWGGGLNNSIFCAEERINSMSTNDMEVFTSQHMRSDTCSIGSYGLEFDEMMTFAEMVESNRSTQTDDTMVTCMQIPYEELMLSRNANVDFKPDPPRRPRYTPYSFARGGFEYHDLGPGSETWVAVAVPSCGMLDVPLLMAHSIVAAACGTGSNSRGQHYEDHVLQPPLSYLASDVHTHFKAFNVSYFDTGVFGIIVRCPSYNANAAASAAARFLRNIGNLTPAQLFIGKKRLQLDIALSEDNCVSRSEGLALQAACKANLDNAYSAIVMLSTITELETITVAKSLASKCEKMAVAVVGDVQAVPHDQELMMSS